MAFLVMASRFWIVALLPLLACGLDAGGEGAIARTSSDAGASADPPGTAPVAPSGTSAGADAATPVDDAAAAPADPDAGSTSNPPSPPSPPPVTDDASVDASPAPAPPPVVNDAGMPAPPPPKEDGGDNGGDQKNDAG